MSFRFAGIHGGREIFVLVGTFIWTFAPWAVLMETIQKQLEDILQNQAELRAEFQGVKRRLSEVEKRSVDGHDDGTQPSTEATGIQHDDAGLTPQTITHMS